MTGIVQRPECKFQSFPVVWTESSRDCRKCQFCSALQRSAEPQPDRHFQAIEKIDNLECIQCPLVGDKQRREVQLLIGRCWIAAALVGMAGFLGGCSPGPVTIAPPRVAQGGRTLSLAITSNNNQRFVAATETGGLFRTFDGGKSWQPNTFCRSNACRMDG
jgi:hypothetical protein